jgi:hypothetical protein
VKRLVVLVLLAFASAFASPSLAAADEDRPRAPGVHHAPPPPAELVVHQPTLYPTPAWLVAQLVPSPEVVIGRQRAIGVDGSIDRSMDAAFGMRWQLTPLLWSFGVHRAQSRWRTFVVDPTARQSGSLELSGTFEYIGGWVDRLLVRPALRVYLPLVQRGDYLSMSLGTSIYAYDSVFRVAYEAGIYALGGLFGLQLTVAPTHDPLASILTLRVRYF